jgi:signal transduction histidine kinase
VKTAPKAQFPDADEVSDLSRQLLQAQEEERRRITRELHDEIGQALMVLRFQMEMLGGEATDEGLQTRIQESVALLDRTIDGLRRTIARLSPRVLEEMGLIAAIRKQAQLLSRHTGMRARLDLPDDVSKLEHDLQVAVYRSVQEALHNVAKHSHGNNFAVRLAIAAGRVSLEVEDDGAGFSPRSAAERGFGLKGMRERASAFRGSLKIRSKPGKGTRIRVIFYLDGLGGTRNESAKPLKRASAA